MRVGFLMVLVLLASRHASAGLLAEGAVGPIQAAHALHDSGVVEWKDVSVRWRVEDNFVADGGRFRFALTIVNGGATAIPSDGWKMYFNFQRRVASESIPQGVRLTFINGDLYVLEPDDGFTEIPSGDERALVLEAHGSAINRSDAPAGFYVVEGQARPQRLAGVTVEPFVEDKQVHRAPADQQPYSSAEYRFRENERVSVMESARVSPILPTPALLEWGEGLVTLDASWSIHHDGALASEALLLADRLGTILGNRPAVAEDETDGPGIIRLRITATDDRDAGESYELRIERESGIEIVGTTEAGVFYGTQSLVGLIPPTNAYGRAELRAVSVRDHPRFDYRGFHLDVARHFEPLGEVKRLLDVLSFYKINRFHLHLTDDEGWRIEIAGLPELTDVGGRRGHTLDEREHLMPSLGSGPDPTDTNSHGNGYYSRAEYIELLRYARARHIEVIPEIDVPGHARAAVVAMEARYHRLMGERRVEEASAFRLLDPNDRSEYRSVQGWAENVMDVCLASTYRFMESVISDLVAMHEEAGVPLRTLHIGGDEVPSGAWTGSPACAQLIAEDDRLERTEDLRVHFIDRVTRMLDDRGLVSAGWEEVVMRQSSREAWRYDTNLDLLDRPVLTYVWNNIWGGGGDDRGYQFANAGYDVVLGHASSLYFDIPHAKHPAEPGLWWAGFTDLSRVFFFTPYNVFQSIDVNPYGQPFDHVTAYEGHERLRDDARHRIRGIQGHLWGQLWNDDVIGQTRLDYMAFPRMLAVAERAWATQPAWEEDYDAPSSVLRRKADYVHFVNQLGRHEMPRLDRLFDRPVAYRLPPPGAVVIDGMLHVNSAVPGLPIHYTTDGSLPTVESSRYREPIVMTDVVRLRTFDMNGRGSRAVEIRP
jgi:hexosaminidase